MIYQELLNFLASNYLSRADALALVNQSVADMAKSNFELLNQTVLDLAGQNAGHFGWMVGGLGVLVTIIGIILGLGIYTEWRKAKKIEERFECRFNDFDFKFNENERCLDDQKNKLFEVQSENKKQQSENKKLSEAIIEESDKLDVKIRLYHYLDKLSSRPIDDNLVFKVYIHYVYSEAYFFRKYRKLAMNQSFFDLINQAKIFLQNLENIDQSDWELIGPWLLDISKISELKIGMLEIHTELNKLFSNTRLNLPLEQPKP